MRHLVDGSPAARYIEAEDVPFIPMGEYWQTTAYRKGVTGIIPGCFTVFYNVKRA
jgi:ABC-type transport system substrate-binding protein